MKSNPFCKIKLIFKVLIGTLTQMDKCENSVCFLLLISTALCTIKPLVWQEDSEAQLMSVWPNSNGHRRVNILALTCILSMNNPSDQSKNISEKLKLKQQSNKTKS